MDVQQLARRQALGVGGQCLERGEVGISGAKGLEIRAIVMGFGEVRPESQRLLELRCRLGEFALVLQGDTQVVVRFGVVRPESERLLKTCRGLVGIA